MSEIALHKNPHEVTLQQGTKMAASFMQLVYTIGGIIVGAVVIIIHLNGRIATLEQQTSVLQAQQIEQNRRINEMDIRLDQVAIDLRLAAQEVDLLMNGKIKITK